MEHEIDNGFENLSPNDEEIVSSSSHGGGVQDVHSGGSHEALTDDVPFAESASSQHQSEESRAHTSSSFVHTLPQTSGCPARSSEKTAECSSCCVMSHIDPRVIDLLLWRDVKKTGIVSASTVVLLLALSCCSVLSVIAYFGLVVLTLSITFRLYCHVMGMMNRSTDNLAPLKNLLECELTIPEDAVRRQADNIAKHLTKSVEYLRRLFLVENVVDSLKFGLILWLLTYVGGWFNGLTLILLASIGLFTLPKVYDTFKSQIDQYVHLACAKTCEVWKKVAEKLPMLAKKKQA